MTLASLAMKSLLNRKLTVFLAILSIALSVFLFLGVEKIRSSMKDSFLGTISGTDLIVGARSTDIQLLLYSVFHMGDATNNITIKTMNDIKKRPEVAWLVPISLGDSYKGYRVVGTIGDYFDRFQYRRNQKLQFAKGKRFNALYDVVIGAQVAKDLSHKLGDRIIIAHGLGSVGFALHDKNPFKLTGILKPTGTSVDRSVFVSLKALEAIHKDFPGMGNRAAPGQQNNVNLDPSAVTAALIGLKSKLGTFTLRRWINQYSQEPITAILPGVAFAKLWRLMSQAQTALKAISALVVGIALLSMLITLLSSMNERQREIAILRSLGARPAYVFSLFTLESIFMVISGILFGLGLLYTALFALREKIEETFGIGINITGLSGSEWAILGVIFLVSVLAGFLPAFKAYRLSLSQGMQVKI